MDHPEVTTMEVLGYLELVAFYVCDFVLAQALLRFKKEYPELDDCSPEESPDPYRLSEHWMQQATHAAADMYNNSISDSYRGAHVSGDARNGDAGMSERDRLYGGAGRPPLVSQRVAHFAVVVASVFGPLAAALMLFMPHSFQWMTHQRPAWIRDVFVAVGLALDAILIARTAAIVKLPEVSKDYWLSLMWFRLDFMLLVGAVALFGFGAVFVGPCLLCVGGYLAYRMVRLEKRLSSLQSETQLLPEEVMDATRVLVPGSEESKKASGLGEGYSNLA